MNEKSDNLDLILAQLSKSLKDLEKPPQLNYRGKNYPRAFSNNKFRTEELYRIETTLAKLTTESLNNLTGPYKSDMVKLLENYSNVVSGLKLEGNKNDHQEKEINIPGGNGRILCSHAFPVVKDSVASKLNTAIVTLDPSKRSIMTKVYNLAANYLPSWVGFNKSTPAPIQRETPSVSPVTQSWTSKDEMPPAESLSKSPEEESPSSAAKTLDPGSPRSSSKG